jgi:hypothetical protein
MELLATLATFLIGLILRLGIPLGLTALVAWGLRRLDARWQAEGEELRRRAIPLGAAARWVRCWEAHDCPRTDKENCPAYGRTDAPCWQVFREIDGRLREPCLSCHLFRDLPAPMAA